MFNALPRYDSYLSHLDWTDAIPAHWQRRRLGTLLRETSGRSLDGSEQLLRVSQYTGVTERRATTTGETDSRAETLVGYKTVRSGQLVVNIMLAWNGSLGVSAFDGVVSPAYCVYSFKPDVEPWYFHYLLRSPQFKSRIKAHSRGVVDSRLRLYSEDLYRLDAPLPPFNEQAAIVKYLAHATARIDKAIWSKRRAISLLREQRGALLELLISGKATRPFRSARSWALDTVPEGWKEIRVKQIVGRIDQGWSPQCEAQPAAAHEWGVLKVGCSNFGRFRPDENKRLPIHLSPRPELEVQHGDLLISRANTRELVGSAAVALNPPARRMLSDKTFRLTVDSNRADAEFLALSLSTHTSRSQIESGAVGASDSMQNISQDVIKNLWIGLPDLSEQQILLRQFKERSRAVQGACEQAEREIELLREFRTRLIADVVTGQVDVRAIAADLPDVDPTSVWGSTDVGDESEDPELDEAVAEGA